MKVKIFSGLSTKDITASFNEFAQHKAVINVQCTTCQYKDTYITYTIYVFYNEKIPTELPKATAATELTAKLNAL